MLLRFTLPLLVVPLLSGAENLLVIRDITVVEPRATPRPHMTLVVRDDRIQSVEPAAGARVPAGARVIDGRGKFLIPGLWDMHVHLWYSQNQLPAYVAHGITGVRDMGSDFARLNAWRTRIRDGSAPGPHILTSGAPVAAKESGDPKLPIRVVQTPEEARRAVDEIEASGADFVKILTNLSRDAYVALAERARQLELDFAGHLPAGITPDEAVDARQNSIEHMFGLTRPFATDPARPLETFDEARAREFFRRSAAFGTWQVPTLTLWKRMAYVDTQKRVSDPRLSEVQPAIRKTWPNAGEEIAASKKDDALELQKQLKLMMRLVRIMQEEGAGILAGTDTGDPYTIPGITLHEELAMLVEAGLTPSEALATATVNPAKFLGWDDKSGSIAPGFLADFVVLDANPLSDIRNVSKVAGVAVRGRYSNRAALARMLAPAASR